METTRPRLTFAGHATLRSNETLLEFVIRAADAFWVTATLWFACAIYPQAWSSREGTAAALGLALFYIIGHAQGLQRPLDTPGLGGELKRVWLVWCMVTPLLLGLAFATKTTDDYSRIIMTTWFVLAPTAVALSRHGLRLLMNRVHESGYNTRTVAIAGASALGEELARGIHDAPWMGLKFVGYYDDRRASRNSGADGLVGAVKGDLTQLCHAARNGAVDIVYIALPLRAEPRINAIIRSLQDTTASVYLACDFGGVDILRAEWSQIGSVPAMSVVETPFHGIEGLTKRASDLVLSCVCLVLFALPMALIALAIKRASPGPVLIRQRRSGLHGESMHVLKFRTTFGASEDATELTPIGAFLKRTALEELPQLFQVLVGDMSIVGPRPHSALHNAQYGALISDYTLRLRVKPGMTGWAQVNAWRIESDTLDKMQRRIEYDLAYIRNWTIWLDLKILLLTVRCCARGWHAK
ncbi:MAG TPA: undecaprenyl-phosphate glucose phosphotransferase [Polyangiales bacterium]|nr:undecaprenyl-phosphate glucose phosphotransferase [Polyangiales bacterium]